MVSELHRSRDDQRNSPSWYNYITLYTG